MKFLADTASHGISEVRVDTNVVRALEAALSSEKLKVKELEHGMAEHMSLSISNASEEGRLYEEKVARMVQEHVAEIEALKDDMRQSGEEKVQCEAERVSSLEIDISRLEIDISRLEIEKNFLEGKAHEDYTRIRGLERLHGILARIVHSLEAEEMDLLLEDELDWGEEATSRWDMQDSRPNSPQDQQPMAENTMDGVATLAGTMLSTFQSQLQKLHEGQRLLLEREGLAAGEKTICRLRSELQALRGAYEHHEQHVIDVAMVLQSVKTYEKDCRYAEYLMQWRGYRLGRLMRMGVWPKNVTKNGLESSMQTYASEQARIEKERFKALGDMEVSK